MFSYIKRDNFHSQLLWFLRIKRIHSQKLCARLKIIDFNEAFIPYNELQFFDWPSIVAHLPTGLMYIAYGLVIMVHRNIQVTNIMISCIQLRQALSVSIWKKSWLQCIILTKAHSLKSDWIVTECISDHNDTNKQ